MKEAIKKKGLKGGILFLSCQGYGRQGTTNANSSSKHITSKYL